MTQALKKVQFQHYALSVPQRFDRAPHFALRLIALERSLRRRIRCHQSGEPLGIVRAGVARADRPLRGDVRSHFVEIGLGVLDQLGPVIAHQPKEYLLGYILQIRGGDGRLPFEKLAQRGLPLAKPVYVVVAFRAGFPEISPYNKVFSTLKASGGIAAEIHPRIAPAEGDIIVAKRRVSAFMGTDLDMILRSNGIHTLVMCGVVTSGVVLSTLCHAADSDYRLFVLRDCCSDIDQGAHALLVERVFPRHATILTSIELIHILNG